MRQCAGKPRHTQKHHGATNALVISQEARKLMLVSRQPDHCAYLWLVTHRERGLPEPPPECAIAPMQTLGRKQTSRCDHHRAMPSEVRVSYRPKFAERELSGSESPRFFATPIALGDDIAGLAQLGTFFRAPWFHVSLDRRLDLALDRNDFRHGFTPFGVSSTFHGPRNFGICRRLKALIASRSRFGSCDACL
jgi:hypothetical protein